uniref:Heme-binding protein soul5 n=1 Tax=Cyprinus carpio TaxID=7962 RepID=A0A8C1RMQ9_CYPCA
MEVPRWRAQLRCILRTKHSHLEGAIRDSHPEHLSYLVIQIFISIIYAFHLSLQSNCNPYLLGAKIDMTAPVIIKVNDSASMCLIDIFCAFYWIERGFFTLVNSILQVYFTNTPGMKVYVKSYGGWMMSAVAISQAQSLKTSLDNVQATHETEYYYNVGYNSPMKIMNRHVEAWYIVEGEPVCPKME